MLRALATVDRDQGQWRFPGRFLPECFCTFLPESSGKILGSWRSCRCHSTPVPLCRKRKKKKKEARETETLTFTTAHSFKQPICQTRLNITAGTTIFSFLVFDFKWNDSFLIVCHNPKSVVSDFNSKWTHTHTRAHTCSHERTNEHVHACIQSCSRGGGWLPFLCESDKAKCKQWRRATWRIAVCTKRGEILELSLNVAEWRGTVFLTPLCLFNFLF